MDVSDSRAFQGDQDFGAQEFKAGRLYLCNACLESTAKAVPVGKDPAFDHSFCKLGHEGQGGRRFMAWVVEARCGRPLSPLSPARNVKRSDLDEIAARDHCIWSGHLFHFSFCSGIFHEQVEKDRFPESSWCEEKSVRLVQGPSFR